MEAAAAPCTAERWGWAAQQFPPPSEAPPPAVTRCCRRRLPVQAALYRYLATTVEDFPKNVGQLEVFQFSHGQSNPTYLLKAMPTNAATARAAVPLSCSSPTGRVPLGPPGAPPPTATLLLISCPPPPCLSHRPETQPMCCARSRRGGCCRLPTPWSGSIACWRHCRAPRCRCHAW